MNSLTPQIVTKFERGDTLISVRIYRLDDGGIRIEDHSYGPVADEFYGEGRDIEHWIDIDSTGVDKLLTKLLIQHTDSPSETLADHFVDSYRGDTRALRQIIELCDSLEVPYDEEIWP